MMPEPKIEAERFTAIRKRFEELGEQLTDDQLLLLADTYHEILRLRRHRRASSRRFRELQRAPEESRSFVYL